MVCLQSVSINPFFSTHTWHSTKDPDKTAIFSPPSRSPHVSSPPFTYIFLYTLSFHNNKRFVLIWRGPKLALCASHKHISCGTGNVKQCSYCTDSLCLLCWSWHLVAVNWICTALSLYIIQKWTLTLTIPYSSLKHITPIGAGPGPVICWAWPLVSQAAQGPVSHTEMTEGHSAHTQQKLSRPRCYWNTESLGVMLSAPTLHQRVPQCIGVLYKHMHKDHTNFNTLYIRTSEHTHTHFNP